MSRATLVVDGSTILDGDYDQWQPKQVEQLAELVKPGHQLQMWRMVSCSVIAHHLQRNIPVRVTVTTSPDGWRMGVDYR